MHEPAPEAARRRPEPTAALDHARVRADFPALDQRVRGKRLIYLDTAATSLKPRQVVERLSRFYLYENANIHRGVHYLSEEATRSFEGARARVQRFINAADAREVVFTRGATEAINLVAQSFARGRLREGDEVLITELEHHANIVPWQMVCKETGARLRVAPINDRGEVELEAYEALLGERTRMVALNHISNALGTINPVGAMTAMARERGIPVLLDGAQAVLHGGVDVRALGCDFYVFSGHKMLAPTGIGCLYGRLELLEDMPPYQGGGDMIRSVTFEETLYAGPPHRFEAGTPHIAGAIGLAAAIDYIEATGLSAIARYEAELLAYCTEVVSEVPGLRIIGEAERKASVVSFTLDGIHPHDVGTILDASGVAVRAGHHCAQPVMARFGVAATARASLAFYNDRADIDALGQAIRQAVEVFA